MLAAETLGLDARTIGIAFGLGVLSVPLQLVASRFPLSSARANLRRFLVTVGIQCGVLAGLAAVGATGAVAVIALAVTVLAEISLSVLFAPAWQPMLSYAFTTEVRQRLNSQVAALGRGLAALVLVAFGATGGGGARAGILMAVAVLAVLLAVLLRSLPAPSAGPRPQDTGSLAEDGRASGPLPRAMRTTAALNGIAALSIGWPLVVIYADEVMWPTANLGLLGAAQLGGTLLGALGWRATAGDVVRRAGGAAVVLVASAVAFALLRLPVDEPLEELAVIVLLTVSGAARTTFVLSVLEMSHRAITPETAVRGLTVLDVVASTSLQVGLLVAGFLVSLSESVSGDWAVDVYRLYLVAGALALAVALHRWRDVLRPAGPSPAGRASPSTGAATS